MSFAAPFGLSFFPYLGSLRQSASLAFRLPAFIGVYQAAFVINDAITATLLFALFTFTRSSAVLVLVSAYVFTAIIAACHMLTFPGPFSPTGWLGAQPQSTAWLYMLWHGTFPLAILVYVR